MSTPISIFLVGFTIVDPIVFSWTSGDAMIEHLQSIGKQNRDY